MKYFAPALIASATYARGTSGGILQGNNNPSLGATHGYGYNIGNDYFHGDSHGHNMGHQNAYEDNTLSGASYVNDNVNLHIWGYDSVEVDPTFVEPDAIAAVTAIKAEILLATTARTAYIEGVLEKRRLRLSDIHEDNLLKIEAPFDFQLDMLEEEVEDVTKAKTHATQDLTDAYDDLLERMQTYLADRIDALNREKEKVDRIIERAVEDGKPLDDVVDGLRLDWLQGVYVMGDTAFFDDAAYDLHVFDSEFDIFTFDIGVGKGHGHRTSVQGPGNSREQGFVQGRGGRGDINELNGEPVPVDGVRGRYDRVT